MAQGNADDVTAWAGLMLVLETMRALRLEDVAAKHLPAVRRQRGFAPEEKLEALVLLLAAGGERVEDICRLAEDKGLQRLLGAPFPSPDALLDFLGQFHDAALVARGASAEATTATVDADGTIIEAHKREALVAYEGTRGYQPLVAVWAEEGLVLADEFRDGNVAGGEDPLSCAKRAFECLPPQVKQRYYRADSASYFGPLLKYLAGEGIGFSISADMTKEFAGRLPGAARDGLGQAGREDDGVRACHGGGIRAGPLAEGRCASALRGGAPHAAAGQLLRGKWPQVLGRRHQPPRVVRARAEEVALGQGGHHRTCPPRHEGRVGRRRHAQRPLRRQRGVVSHQRHRLQTSWRC